VAHSSPLLAWVGMFGCPVPRHTVQTRPHHLSNGLPLL